MIIKSDIEQGSPAWHELHGSVPSASNFSKIVTTKGEPSKQAKDYMMQLAGTRVWGVFEDSYQSWHMQQGLEREGEWKSMYSIITGNELQDVGFCYYDKRLDRGCSPDSLVIGANGFVEGKAPLLKTHVKYIIDDKLPIDYFQQCQGSLYITELEWLDFISYFPDTPLFIKRVYRDKPFIKKLAAAIDQFNEQLDALVERLKSK